MKQICLFILISLSHLAFGQAEKEVEAAAEKLRVAMIDPNAEQLKLLTASDLSYGHSSGVIEDQAKFINNLTSGGADFKSIEISDQAIQLHGKNTAVVRSNFKGELLNADGTSRVISIGVLMIWVKEKEGWKLLARQGFKVQ